ncbi:helix-turn-helix domain-containing protein [Paraburkholderia rhizosphaerae]|uniref:Helix-turn-helix protein n=1 Tax=Paraburkholderia rhizosphaerae TaxID=480658 RepID=A0A4R8LQD7_9BURK|nr:helix-turn-helix transcriptional regulator [Paraburkholderia rhizosphaerae]TDY47723.1 hypothetical protein BX592_112111 [Paraburkholderia rhizosphaerae]
MDLPALLDAAKRGKGSLKEIATELGIHPNRLSDWRAGRLKPNASEVAYLAECANLPILETVADIESQLDSQHASIWKKALGTLRAAGVAATLVLGIAMASMLSPKQATAAEHDGMLPSHGRGHWFDPSTTHQNSRNIA